MLARDGCLLTGDGTVISGREGIRSVLRQLIAMGVAAEVEPETLVIAGDTALAKETWTTRFVRSNGADYSRVVATSAVVRHPEGARKLHIAAPWGWG